MPHVMLTIELEPDEVDFGSVKRSLELQDSEVDDDFGLVALSPRRHLYTLLVESSAAARVRGRDRVSISSNPRIEAFDDRPMRRPGDPQGQVETT